MAERSEPRAAGSPLQSQSSGRELSRSPGKLDSGLSGSGHFQKLPTTFGRFRIFRLLGHGAMGSVYLAFDPEIGKEVALKIPKADLAQDPMLWERFQREARAAGDLNHPYICGMYEVGQIGPTHFFSMEYVPGRSLKEYISDRQPQRKVAGVVRKLALGLAHAHSMGIVHRDLKPANVMIDATGQPKLMDFGLVRRLDDSDIRATNPGVIIGSPGYMAPEQAMADHDNVGPKTDIYGLGVLFFELLTGSLPFVGPVLQVLTQIATQPPPKPSSLRPDIDPRLEELCLKMLAKAPQDRPRSMADVAQTLTLWLKSGETSSGTASVGTSDSDVKESGPDEAARLFEAQKADVGKLVRQQEYAAAIELLEKMTEQRGKPAEVAWAAGELLRVRAEAEANSPVALAIRSAEQSLLVHDFAAAVKAIEAVAPGDRNPKANELLQKSVRLRDECERLRRDIENAIYTSDARSLSELVEELLKRQPSQPAVCLLADELKRFGPARLIAHRRCEDIPGLRRSLLRWPLAVVVGLIVTVGLVSVRGAPASRVIATATEAKADSDAAKNETVSSEESVPKPEVPSVPHVERLEELAGEGPVLGLWIAPDGLRIYWESGQHQPSQICVASRSSNRELFGNVELLVTGRHPTLSADELTLMFTVDDKLYVALRQDRDESFGAPKNVKELQSSDHVKSPSLTADGLHLVWQANPNGSQSRKFWESSRKSPTASWEKPRALTFKDVPHVNSISWPRLLDDGKSLLCNDESSAAKHRFVLLRREKLRDPFKLDRSLEPKGIEGFFGRAAQYVASTDEFYFLSPENQERTANLKDPLQIFRLTGVRELLGDALCQKLSVGIDN